MSAASPGWRRDHYLVSTSPDLIDLPLVHRFLSTSTYWSRGIPLEVVRRSLENCLAFGLYDVSAARENGLPGQIGLARVITDRATFAYIGDVFVLDSYRGRGLSKWLMEIVAAHPELQGLRRWMLLTADAHGLYKRYGFTEPSHPEWVMERVNPRVYEQR